MTSVKALSTIMPMEGDRPDQSFTIDQLARATGVTARNTSGASAFLALWQAVREGRLQQDAYALIVAFGAGFTWGAALCRVSTAKEVAFD